MEKYNWLKIKNCKPVITKDVYGKPNGELINILNRNDDIFNDRRDELFQQFYMITVRKNTFKGLHIHPHKLDTVFVVYGKVCLVIYPEEITKEKASCFNPIQDKYIFIELGDSDYKTISYPSIYPHGFWGIAEESILINYRNPAWEPSDTYQFDIIDKDLINKLQGVYHE